MPSSYLVPVLSLYVGCVGQESPTSGLWTDTGLWPIGTQATQQEVSGERAKLHLYSQLFPSASITTSDPPQTIRY